MSKTAPKTLSIVVGTSYSDKTTTIRAKRSEYSDRVYYVSKRQIRNAEKRMGMMKGDAIKLNDHKKGYLHIPQRADYAIYMPEWNFETPQN